MLLLLTGDGWTNEQMDRQTDRQIDKENLMAIVCFNLYWLDKFFSPKKACLERLRNEKA